MILDHPPHLLLRNGRVAAGPTFTPSATAVAIAEDRIVAVGSDDELAALSALQTTVVDLGGRTVIPGLIDGHVHLMRAGQTWEEELHWDGLPTLAEAVGTIQRAASTLRPGEWIRVVGGWHPTQFHEGRGPTQAELDAHGEHLLCARRARRRHDYAEREGSSKPMMMHDGPVLEELR